MGTHLRVLSESYPMNTNMTGFGWLSKIFASLCFGWGTSLSIGRVEIARKNGLGREEEKLLDHS